MRKPSENPVTRGLRAEPNGTTTADAHERIFVYRLRRGPKEEEPVSNQAFLASYLDYGVWMRTLAASAHVEILERKHTTPTARIASIAALYQVLGLSAEDTLAALIAWATWAWDKSLRMADLLERSHFRFSKREGIADKDYCDQVRERLVETRKRVDIEPRQFIATLLEKYNEQLPQQFGIPWKRDPSVKLVPKQYKKDWDLIPLTLREFLETVASPNGRILTACHNKLKHGPQIVVTTFNSMRMARDFDEVKDAPSPHRPVLRVLLDGARTQETPAEGEAGDAVAPYIPDDDTNIRRHLLQGLVHDAFNLSVLGTWIFNCEFPHMRRRLQHEDRNVRALCIDLLDEVRRIRISSERRTKLPVGMS